MLKSYLLENYGYNEPIFLNDLKIEELSENAVRQSVKRLVANGFLERYDNGIYYIPKQGGLLGKSYLDPFLVIMRKYVRSKSETFGYVTGISFVNQLGLTTQMPAKYTELPMEETIDTMLSYVKQKRFTKEQLSEVSPVITGATAKKLIEWGMIYEFAS